MNGQPITPASITLIPLIIAIAVALSGFLVVTVFAHHESDRCDEMAELIHRDNRLRPGSDEYQTLDAIRASC